MTYDGHYLYSYDPENRLTKVKKPEQGPGALTWRMKTYRPRPIRRAARRRAIRRR